MSASSYADMFAASVAAALPTAAEIGGKEEEEEPQPIPLAGPPLAEEQPRRSGRLEWWKSTKRRRAAGRRRRFTLGEALARRPPSGTTIRVVGQLVTDANECGRWTNAFTHAFLSNNLLQGFLGLPSTLVSLSVTNNCLDYLDALDALRYLRRLQTLAIAGNDVCRIPGHRARAVALASETLSKLDGKCVDRPTAIAADAAHTAAWDDLAQRAETQRLLLVYAPLRRCHARIAANACTASTNDIRTLVRIWRPRDFDRKILEDASKTCEDLASLAHLIHNGLLDAFAKCSTELTKSQRKGNVFILRTELWHTLPPQQRDPGGLQPRHEPKDQERDVRDNGDLLQIRRQSSRRDRKITTASLHAKTSALARFGGGDVVQRHAQSLGDDFAEARRLSPAADRTEKVGAVATATIAAAIMKDPIDHAVSSALREGPSVRLARTARSIGGALGRASSWLREVDHLRLPQETTDVGDSGDECAARPIEQPETIGSLQARVKWWRRRIVRLGDGRTASCLLAEWTDLLSSDLSRRCSFDVSSDIALLETRDVAWARSFVSRRREALGRAEAAEKAFFSWKYSNGVDVSQLWQSSAQTLLMAKDRRAADVATRLAAKVARKDAILAAENLPALIVPGRCLLDRVLSHWASHACEMRKVRLSRLGLALGAWRKYKLKQSSKRIWTVSEGDEDVQIARSLQASGSGTNARNLRSLSRTMKRRLLALGLEHLSVSATRCRRSAAIAGVNVGVLVARRHIRMWRLHAGIKKLLILSKRLNLRRWSDASRRLGHQRGRGSRALEFYMRNLLHKSLKAWKSSTSSRNQIVRRCRLEGLVAYVSKMSAVAKSTAMGRWVRSRRRIRPQLAPRCVFASGDVLLRTSCASHAAGVVRCRQNKLLLDRCEARIAAGRAYARLLVAATEACSLEATAITPECAPPLVNVSFPTEIEATREIKSSPDILERAKRVRALIDDSRTRLCQLAEISEERGQGGTKERRIDILQKFVRKVTFTREKAMSRLRGDYASMSRELTADQQATLHVAELLNSTL